MAFSFVKNFLIDTMNTPFLSDERLTGSQRYLYNIHPSPVLDIKRRNSPSSLHKEYFV